MNNQNTNDKLTWDVTPDMAIPPRHSYPELNDTTIMNQANKTSQFNYEYNAGSNTSRDHFSNRFQDDFSA